MKNEEWREVKGFPGYEVSNLGRVFSHKTNKIMTTDKTGQGRVYLSDPQGVKKTRSVSTLMRENWKWEWIKDIKDGEEFRECWGFPGYFISNRGRVFSLETYNFLTPNKGCHYYWKVRVGGRKTNSPPLHTLVGRTFLDWEEGLLILHKDETLSFPEINWVENLWVGTSSDNNKDTWDKGRNQRQPGQINNPYGRKGKPH